MRRFTWQYAPTADEVDAVLAQIDASRGISVSPYLYFVFRWHETITKDAHFTLDASSGGLPPCNVIVDQGEEGYTLRGWLLRLRNAS